MRLIDADRLEFYVKNLPKRIKYPTVGDPWIHELVEVQAVLDTIKDAPTIEAKPVVHAHWNNDGRCTNCGEHAPFFAWADEWYETKYCHGCGAQMDGTDINVGSKEPISQTHENGVKIPVISMEDVPKIMEEER